MKNEYGWTVRESIEWGKQMKWMANKQSIVNWEKILKAKAKSLKAIPAHLGTQPELMSIYRNL